MGIHGWKKIIAIFVVVAFPCNKINSTILTFCNNVNPKMDNNCNNVSASI